MRAPLLVVSLASLALNAGLGWALWARSDDGAPVGAAPATHTGPAAVGASAGAAVTTSNAVHTKDARVASLAALVQGAHTERPKVDGAAPVLVDKALMNDVQCRVARERAADSFRNDADGIRRALQVPIADEAIPMRTTQRKNEVADALGLDDTDARVGALAEQFVALEDQASDELARLMAPEKPDWNKATQVVAELYRAQNAAARETFGAESAEELRLALVDERAAILAIGASLADKPWSSFDDVTAP